MTGFTWHMRHPGGAPAGLGFAYADVASGYAAALAIIAALWRRRRDGRGAALDVAQIGVVESLLVCETDLPDAAGNAAPEGEPAPHGVYRCADSVESGDRWIAIAVFGDADWQRLAAVIDAPWTADARFASHAARRAQATALEVHLAAWTRAHDADALTTILQAAGVCAGACADAADLCERDPQLAARGYFAGVAGVVLDGPTPRLGATPGRSRAAGPRLDEHRTEVLRRVLGMDEKTV